MIEINKKEAMILRAAMFALDREARSDEPHYAHGPEFSELTTKLQHFIDNTPDDDQ